MPNPHFDISIVQRSKGKSAVAGAAYQSGEKLFSEYDQTYKDYRNKHVGKQRRYCSLRLSPETQLPLPRTVSM